MTTANQSPTLMDLCADGVIPEPLTMALRNVRFDPRADGPIVTVQLLIATAITVMELERDDCDSDAAMAAIYDLRSAGCFATEAFAGEREPEPQPTLPQRAADIADSVIVGILGAPVMAYIMLVGGIRVLVDRFTGCRCADAP